MITPRADGGSLVGMGLFHSMAWRLWSGAGAVVRGARSRRVTAAVVVLLAGCGARSGVLPGEIEPAAGGGGAGATSATAGAGGVGAGGSASGGAGGGVVGGGGAGGGGAGGGPQAQSIIEACALAVGCGESVTWPFFTTTSCIDDFGLLGWYRTPPAMLPDPTIAARLLDCAAEATGDCTTFRDCFGGDWVALSRCREGAGCTGNVIGGQAGEPSFDCGVIGGTCTELFSNALRACCNAGPCDPTGEAVCDGNVSSACGIWGEHVVFDCGVSGRTCQSDPQAVCVGSGQACSPETLTTCSGDVATYCSGGKLATYDCGNTQFRSRCNLGGGSAEPACRPAGDSCNPGSMQDTCKGSTLVACVDGELLGIDCPSLGFAGCADSGNGARCGD